MAWTGLLGYQMIVDNELKSMIYSTSFGIIGRTHQTIYFIIISREAIQFTYAGDGC